MNRNGMGVDFILGDLCGSVAKNPRTRTRTKSARMSIILNAAVPENSCTFVKFVSKFVGRVSHELHEKSLNFLDRITE